MVTADALTAMPPSGPSIHISHESVDLLVPVAGYSVAALEV